MFIGKSAPQHIIRIGHDLHILSFQVGMGHTGLLKNALPFFQMNKIEKINRENTPVNIAMIWKTVGCSGCPEIFIVFIRLFVFINGCRDY